MSLMSSFKGWFGEALMSGVGKLMLDSDVYKQINNVTIPTSNGTTQIDHIIVSRYGIFVIETKNMEGWIFGSASQPKWTQSIFGKKFQFQNPLHQNHRHIKALEEFLELPIGKFYSVVSFIGETTDFKTDLPDNVINGGPFGYIKSFKTELLTEDEVMKAVESIKSGMKSKNFLGLATPETKREHLASLRDRYSSTTTCPKCGADLVLSTAKQGAKAGKQYYVCSKYPVCKLIKPAGGEVRP